VRTFAILNPSSSKSFWVLEKDGEFEVTGRKVTIKGCIRMMVMMIKLHSLIANQAFHANLKLVSVLRLRSQSKTSQSGLHLSRRLVAVDSEQAAVDSSPY